MKKLNLKYKLPPIHLWISLTTFFLTSFPANAQDFFSGARKNADTVFKDAGSGVDVSIIPNLFFGGLLLFLFAAAAWQGITAYREIGQGGAEGANWAPILYGFISFALLLVFIGFAQKTLFGAAT
jgi:hypothetical protein